MKRLLIIGTLVVLTGLLAIPAFAGNNDTSGWWEQMLDLKKSRVDSLVESGQMTEEQGAAFKEHFDQVYQWQQENGFVCPGPGGGFGRGPWWMNDSGDRETPAFGAYGRGMGRGLGRGMGPGARGQFLPPSSLSQ